MIRRHRRQSGSPWRKLNPGRRALLVLACLHKGETVAELAAGFGIGAAFHDAGRFREELRDAPPLSGIIRDDRHLAQLPERPILITGLTAAIAP